MPVTGSGHSLHHHNPRRFHFRLELVLRPTARLDHAAAIDRSGLGHRAGRTRLAVDFKLPISRLPGDIMIDRPHGFKLFFPLTTTVIASAW